MEKYFRDNYVTDEEFKGDVADTLSIGELCEIALTEYERCANYPRNIHDYPQLYARVADHLRGIPAPFAPSVYYSEIEEILREWEHYQSG